MGGGSNQLKVITLEVSQQSGATTDATEEQKSKVDEVRSIVRSKQWCKEVNINS